MLIEDFLNLIQQNKARNFEDLPKKCVCIQPRRVRRNLEKLP